ncbi:MAG: 4a-hydroxytetrahydrobiopterin dehydratase [Gammaproteobacteria bacterium]
MNDLTDKKCLPCEGGVDPLDRAGAEALMDQLHGDWKLNDKATEIARTFRFKDFHQTMSFVNAVAWVANGEDHHPDMEVGWGRCHVVYSTHAISGLSENDFICAAKIDALF